MNGHLIIFAIDVTAVFGALLLAVGITIRFPHNRNALLMAAILIGNICWIVLSRYEYGYWIPEPYRLDVEGWEPLMNICRNLAPGLFMLLCHSMFQEGRSFPRWLLALFILQLLLEEPVHLILPAGAPLERLVTEAVPALLQSLFGMVALYWTVSGWASDLVETRRRMRWIILVIIGIAMFATSLLTRVLIPWNLVENYYAHVTSVGLTTVLISVLLLTLLGKPGVKGFLDPATPAPRALEERIRIPNPSAQAADADMVRLQRLMNEEHVYREAGLSVARLAERMAMPEYRLRKLIHEQLGYRNFNAFLHDHRIREACDMLRNPSLSRTPILTIALSVGYQSINTFNRGFRDVMGMTPSAYRTNEPLNGTEPEPE